MVGELEHQSTRAWNFPSPVSSYCFDFCLARMPLIVVSRELLNPLSFCSTIVFSGPCATRFWAHVLLAFLSVCCKLMARVPLNLMGPNGAICQTSAASVPALESMF